MRSVSRRTLLKGGAAGVFTLSVGACSSFEPDPTELEFAIVADGGINPNENGEPSPVLVRIYELKSTDAFETATFFDLLDNDRALIGEDLVTRREVELKPGETQPLEKETSADTLYIGVIAGFRDIDNAQWRDVAEIKSETGNQLLVTVTGLSIAIERKPSRGERLRVFG